MDRWTDERPGIPQDEFIDDIPFPETQNYVKRILGTAEDYRYLYGGGLLDPNLRPAAAAVNSAPAAKTTPAKAASAKTPSAKAPTTPSRSTSKKKTTAAKKTSSTPARH